MVGCVCDPFTIHLRHHARMEAQLGFAPWG